MYLLTHINKDGSYSVKDTVADATKHFTLEELNAMSPYKVQILGVFRDSQTGQVTEIHPVQPNELSEGLIPVIEMIKTPELQTFAHCCRRWIPEYFFTTAASSSGKYHPASNLGYGGLLRHTVFVCKMLKYITEIESTQQMFNLTQVQIDMMLVACMLHDSSKDGWEYNLSTYSEHPLRAAKAVRGMVGFLPQAQLEFIAQCIESHMGQWNTDRQGNVITPKPSNTYQWLVHLSDFLASRPDVSLTYNGTVYVKENEKVETIAHKIKNRLEPDDCARINRFRAKIKTDEAYFEKIKGNYGITRTSAEVYDILDNCVKYGATEKQQKYVDMALAEVKYKNK